jgi:Fe2+ transport system protein FeoA
MIVVQRSWKLKKAVLLSILAVAVQLSVGVIAEAQQPTRISRIGILLAPSASFYSARVEAFRQRLRELGYVEGKNIVIEYRYQKGNSNGCLNLQPSWSISKLT